MINRLGFITEVGSVYRAVRTDSLYITDTFHPYRVKLHLVLRKVNSLRNPGLDNVFRKSRVRYSRTPLIRINWDGEQSGYA